jgi:lysophospholipase L1-like esterase
MKKIMTAVLVLTCALLGVSLVACTGEDTPAETTVAPPETTAAPAETTEAIDYGTLAIDDVFAWVGYPENTVIPTFSIPELAETLTYEYDSTGITIDPATNSVTALKAGRYEVKATSEHFSAEFIVRAEEVDTASSKYSASNFASAADNRAAQWKANGNDGKTTLFIGDSFFDTGFWTGFYTASYPGKDALCLGISATTTYDWEQWIGTWLGATKPKNIVMHVGTNNVYDDGDNIFGALSAYQRMFLLMHEQFPDTHIYWFGVTQRAYDNDKIGQVTEINARMQKWCAAQDFITYIDTPSLIKKDMLKDEVHPKPENYSVFVDELAKTDIVIEDGAPVIVNPEAEIADITFAKSQTIAAGTAVSGIKYKGNDLSANYIVSGKLDIRDIGTNAHIQFGILDSGNNRILLWDNESAGKFKICIPYDTNVPAEDICHYTAGQTLTVEWKVVCHNDYVYFFIGNELKLVYTAINNTQKIPLTIGSENVDCSFYDMQALTLADDKAEYDKAIAEMSDIISKYSGYTNYQRLRAD